MQIIINRISLLMADQFQARQLKWGTFVIVSIIGITVNVIWIPASLQISDKWIFANEVWDRLKQCILTVMDIALNGYFLYMVHSHLISNGLHKYTNLFKYNVVMVVLVVILDVSPFSLKKPSYLNLDFLTTLQATLVGLMSLPVAYA